MRDLDWEYYYFGNFEVNIILLNKGFFKLKESGIINGVYWKKQLVLVGIIKI